jgi:lysozyme
MVDQDTLALCATKLVEPFEGFSAKPYLGPTGRTWTIGFGSTRDAKGYAVVANTPAVTRAEALLLVERDLKSAAACIDQHVTVPLNVNQEAALMDMVYNDGEGAFESSTLLRLLNQGDFCGAANQLLVWDKGTVSGHLVTLPGLKNRCQARRSLFAEGLNCPDP